MRRLNFPLLAAALLLGANGAWVCADDFEATSHAPKDAAFECYVDLSLLELALSNLDAAQAADVALQLAEGERILGRTHAAISADSAFDLALKIALQSQDAETIDRLLAVSTKNCRGEWTDRLTATKGLLGASRTVEPELDASGMSDAGREFTEAVVQGLRLAQVAGDAAAVAEYKAIVQESDLLDKAAQASLLKFADDLNVTPADDLAPGAAEVETLLSDSRSSTYFAPAGTLAISVSGGGVLPGAGKAADIQISNKLPMAIYCPPDSSHPGVLKISPGKTFYVDAKSSKVTVTTWKTVETKVPRVVIRGTGVKVIYVIQKRRVPYKVITIPVGFGLTGKGKTIKAVLK